MNKVISFLLFLIVFLEISCNSTKEEELRLKEKELKLKEKELELKEKSQTLNENTLKSNRVNTPVKQPTTSESNNPQIPIPESETKGSVESKYGIVKFCYVFVTTNEPEIKLQEKFLPNGNLDSKLIPVPEVYVYKSAIVEVKYFNQDEKYRLIDKYEGQVRQGFSFKNMQLTEYNTECKIISSECYVFDNYSTASQHRRNKNK